MTVIAIVGNKGGAGKTTLTVNIASGLNRKSSTAVIDADPQQSSVQWRVFSEEGTVPVYQAEDDLAKQCKKLKKDYQQIIIDCPPSVYAQQTNDALLVTDHAIIPVQPSPMDLWATVHIIEAVETAREKNKALQALLVINQLEPKMMLSKLVREAVDEIGMPVAKTMIRRRAIYRNAALEGKSVYDAGKRGTAAMEEIEQLIREILQ